MSLLLEGVDERRLSKGDLARVGPQTRRQLVNRGPQRLVLLALGGADQHQSRDALTWESWADDGPGRQPAEVPLPPDLPAKMA